MHAEKAYSMTSTILIAAGGTGGHVFPALAVAETLRRKKYSVIWVGTARGIETTVVPKNNFPLFFIHARGIRGKGWLQTLWMPFVLCFALCEAIVLILKQRPSIVLGMGGYVSGPVGLAAFLLRIPLVIQEQNARAGFTNRWLSKFATYILTGFPKTFPENTKTIWTGNPIRAEIAELNPINKTITPPDKPLHLLILGGSLGASILNTVLPQTMSLLKNEVRPIIWHQTGTQALITTQQAYQQYDIPAKVEAFIHKMAEAYTWADLVVCRAGALTIAELTAVGLGAILVPFPYATEDHQTQNARYLSEANAAILLPQTQLLPKTLADNLQRFHDNRSLLEQMGKKSATLAQNHATSIVANHVLRALKND